MTAVLVALLVTAPVARPAAPRPGAPPPRASISAEVLRAAVVASASSSPEDVVDQVVRLTVPAMSPVRGSRTGAAAQVYSRSAST